MTLRFKIVNVDTDGACGRENHPHPSDEGLIVIPVKMGTMVFTEDGDDPGGNEDFDIDDSRHIGAANNTAIDGIQRSVSGDSIYSYWTCVTEDGRVLDLMDYELELASAH